MRRRAALSGPKALATGWPAGSALAGSALALATAACFVNPSMAYLYGFVLLLELWWENRRSGDAGGSPIDQER